MTSASLSSQTALRPSCSPSGRRRHGRLSSRGGGHTTSGAATPSIGGSLLARWGMNDRIVEAVTRQRDRWKVPPGTPSSPMRSRSRTSGGRRRSGCAARVGRRSPRHSEEGSRPGCPLSEDYLDQSGAARGCAALPLLGRYAACPDLSTAGGLRAHSGGTFSQPLTCFSSPPRRAAPKPASLRCYARWPRWTLCRAHPP